MGNRIRELRLDRKWTHDEAADAMGVSRGQFIKLERGERRLTNQYIELAAKAFGVGAHEIITDTTTVVPLMGFIGAGAEIHSDHEQVPPDGLQAIEVPFPLPAEMVAFQVRGDSMLPRFRNGDVIIVFREQHRPTESFAGEEAAVRLTDGRRFVKEIVRNGDGFMLLSSNARPITDVDIEWVGEIFTIFPSTQMQRSWRRSAK